MTIMVMLLPAYGFSQEPLRPKKGIRAEVLLDGFSPAPPRELFQLDYRLSLVARFVSEPGRGFTRIAPMAQFPKPASISLRSAPQDLDQYRLAFGMTILEDDRDLRGRMALRLRIGESTSGRFINADDPASCIRFLEAMEGVDSVLVSYRYHDNPSGAIVRGNISL